MPKTELLKLAERVEALSGPDSTVDAEIAVVMDVQPDGTQYTATYLHKVGNSYEDIGKYTNCPAYTASLDAAMTLCQPDKKRLPQLEYIGPNPNNIEDGHRVRLWFNDKKASGQSMVSAALALCAAALRALAKEDS